MKIAIYTRYPRIHHPPRGGVESVAVVLVRALAAIKDLDVHVVTLERDCVEEVLETHHGATIHRLAGNRWPQVMDVISGPGLSRLRDFFKYLKPDIVHSHESRGLLLGCGLMIPHVFTLHGFDTENLAAESANFQLLRTKLWGVVERMGLACQRHIISISPYVRQMIEPYTNAAIHDIYNPVDGQFFDINPCPCQSRILCVGWISERKNTLGTIRSFALATADGKEGTLVIAGQAKDKKYLKKVIDTINRNNVNSRVEILGHVGHERMMDEMRKASLLILPSKQENAPMAIAEAMAAGLPVIASNRCGMPYMVSDNETGFLIDPDDSAQIADRLSRLLQDPISARRMGRAGRLVAKRSFSPDKVAEQTYSLYQDIMAASNAFPNSHKMNLFKC